eukprot:UN26498
MGDGKSSLVKKLVEVGNGNDKPVSDVVAGGVTKTVDGYECTIEGTKYVFFDTPGVGDKDAKLPFVISSIESVLKQVPCSGMIITCSLPKMRITLGAQVAFAVLKAGLINNNENALKNVIVCGTQKDIKLKKVKAWRTHIASGFKERLGGNPGYVVTTALEKQEEDEGEDDI